MPQWIVLRRDDDGVVEHVDGLWDAETGVAAIERMCAERDRTDDGRWKAELPADQEHIMNWALDAESRGKPKPSRAGAVKEEN